MRTPAIFTVGGMKELLLVDMTLPYVVREGVGDLMQEETPRWFDRMLRALESSALFVWFKRRRSRGLKARRWVEDWIKGHYPDEDIQILDCNVRTGRRRGSNVGLEHSTIIELF